MSAPVVFRPRYGRMSLSERVYRCLPASDPGCTAREVAQALEANVAAVSECIKRLKMRQLVAVSEQPGIRKSERFRWTKAA